MNGGKYHFNGQRNSILDFLRGIAILMVVIGHAIQVNLGGGEECFIWSKIILNFQMPLMFLISGYTTGFSFPSNNPIVFIKNKVMRLLIPYLCWACMHYFLVAIQPNNYRNFKINEFLQELLVSDFWFLRMLFIFFLIICVCNLMLHITRCKCALIIMLLISTLCMPLLGTVPMISKSISLWYYLWFLFGYLIFRVLQEKRVKKMLSNSFFSRNLLVSSVLLMIMTLVFLIHNDLPSKLITIVFVCGICVSGCLGEKYIPFNIKRIVIEMGKNTLPIYAIHWCILFSPLFRMKFYVKIFSGTSLVISSITTTLLWLVICKVCISVFTKNKTTRVLLLGEKR